MKFTVLICTHNRGPLIRRTLDAVAASAYAGEWEIVVVDNASTDNTAAVIADAAAHSAVPIRYLYEKRAGKSAALNTGLQHAKGHYVAFTDDDACPRGDWLDQLESAFDTYRADWVFGPVIPLWPEVAPRWFCDGLRGNFALLDYGSDPIIVRSGKHTFFGVNCAARHGALNQAGAFREDLGVFGVEGVGGGEDVEMFERALGLGQTIVYAPSAVVQHIISQEKLSKRFHRNKVWISRGTYYRLVRRDQGRMPTILGVPRYLFVHAGRDLWYYVTHRLRLNSGQSFHHELRLIRFGGLLSEVIAHRYGATKARAG